MENILRFLEKDKNDCKLKIAVVGDAMIDEYYDVKVKRISPECPIPILQMDETDPVSVPGGAANVVRQFENFNTQLSLVSILDNDAIKTLTKSNISIHSSSQIIDKKIPRKKRYFSENTQVARIDVEKADYGMDDRELHEISNSIFRYFRKSSFDAVIFSDYGKGIFKHFDNSLLMDFPLTIVDPKNGDIRKWKNCTVLKPNADEALRLSGKNSVVESGLFLSEYLGCSVAVTEASRGVSVYENGKITAVRPDYKPIAAESVIGAGDCFIAFLTMALLRGFSLVEASQVAFKAGTLYVQNKRNKPLYPADLFMSCKSENEKTISMNDAQFLRDRTFKLAFTNGCFDMMHAGHVHSLKFAKSCADKLIVGVNSDRSVSRLKPGRPIIPQKERIEMLASCEYVDFVVLFDDETPLSLIKAVCPDVVVKGDDYKENEIVGYGIVPEIKRCPLMEGISTTQIIQKIKEN